MSKKINPKSIVFESKTSPFIFITSIVFFVGGTYLLIQTPTFSNFIIIILVFISIFITSFLNFSKKNIYLTKNSIYIYKGETKYVSLSLLNDILQVETRTNKLGTIFNYATLIIVTKDKKIIEYFFLDNAEKMKDKIMLRYEHLMIKSNPNFISTYKPTASVENEDNTKEQKKLDSIEG